MCNERYANTFINQPPPRCIHHLNNMVKCSSEDSSGSINIFIQINKILENFMNCNEVLNKYVHKVKGLLIVVYKVYKWIRTM